ncbi:MAG: nucleotidyltransferase family protein [Thermoplasmata archaeon]
MEAVLGPYRSRIKRIAKQYGAREIRVFGSVARNAASSRSDIDLLVDFDQSKRSKSALRSIDLALELEKLLGRHVDLVTESSLHWFIQPQVVVEAVPL